MKLRSILVAAALFAVAGFAHNAQAAVITGLFNTGVDGSGNALVGGDGVVDPHYTIATSTIGDTIGSNAVTYTHPSYVPNSATSRWISNSFDGNPGNGTVTLQTTFDLTGFNPATASISGLWGIDNLGTIFLNGVDTGISLLFGFPAFEELHPFTISSGFIAGINTLSFLVTDTGPPLALRVEGLVGTAVSAVPELSTWMMMLIGFAAVGFLAFRRSRERAAVPA